MTQGRCSGKPSHDRASGKAPSIRLEFTFHLSWSMVGLLSRMQHVAFRTACKESFLPKSSGNSFKVAKPSSVCGLMNVASPIPQLEPSANPPIGKFTSRASQLRTSSLPVAA